MYKYVCLQYMHGFSNTEGKRTESDLKIFPKLDISDLMRCCCKTTIFKFDYRLTLRLIYSNLMNKIVAPIGKKLVCLW